MARVNIKSPQALVYMQKMLGQKLFFPPNVSGWHSGQAWIDNATLLFRVQLPRYVFLAGSLELMPAASGDMFDQMKLRGGLKKLEAEIDMPALERDFRNVSARETYDFFCQPEAEASPNKDKGLIQTITQLTAKPEFQLC